MIWILTFLNHYYVLLINPVMAVLFFLLLAQIPSNLIVTLWWCLTFREPLEEERREKAWGALNVCPHDHWWCHMFRSLLSCVVQMMPFTFPGTLNGGPLCRSRAVAIPLNNALQQLNSHTFAFVLFEGDSKMNVTTSVTFKQQLLYYY